MNKCENTFHYKCAYKNDRESIVEHNLPVLEDGFIVVQNFSEYQMAKWSTFGSPELNYEMTWNKNNIGMKRESKACVLLLFLFIVYSERCNR